MLKNKKLILMGVNNPQTIRLISDINKSSKTFTYEIIGWIDSDLSKVGNEYFGYKVLGTPSILKEYKYNDCYLVNNITTNADVRYATTQELLTYKLAFETLVHPSVNIDSVKIGNGCIIHENSILESTVEIDDFVVVSSGSIICHETKVGKYTFISSGVRIAGLVNIGEKVTIFLGAVLAPRLSIESGSIVSAGSVVFEDIRMNTIVSGNPARQISPIVSELLDAKNSETFSLQQRLKKLFKEQFTTLLKIKEDEYFADYDLLPSFEMFRLITSLEEEFSIKILDSEIDEKNLGSFENIIIFINNKNYS